MKIVCFADTHGHHKHRPFRIPDGDMLVFAGDYTGLDSHDELAGFNSWLGQFPHSHKLAIAGNHDRIFEQNHYQAKNMLTSATYLNDSMTVIDGLKIWGSPITLTFLDWAFNRDPGSDIQRHWDMIPDDIDILITHGPPYGVLDNSAPNYLKSGNDPHKGSKELFDTISRLKKLKLHIFGHIHESYGQVTINNITYVNCGKGYFPSYNRPIVVEI